METPIFDGQQFVAGGVGLRCSVGVVLKIVVFVVLFLLEIYGAESAMKFHVESFAQVECIAKGDSCAGCVALIDVVSPRNVVGCAEGGYSYKLARHGTSVEPIAVFGHKAYHLCFVSVDIDCAESRDVYTAPFAHHKFAAYVRHHGGKHQSVGLYCYLLGMQGGETAKQQ